MGVTATFPNRRTLPSTARGAYYRTRPLAVASQVGVTDTFPNRRTLPSTSSRAYYRTRPLAAVSLWELQLPSPTVGLYPQRLGGQTIEPDLQFPQFPPYPSSNLARVIYVYSYKSAHECSCGWMRWWKTHLNRVTVIVRSKTLLIISISWQGGAPLTPILLATCELSNITIKVCC